MAKDNYRCGPMKITNILKMLPLFSLLFCHFVAWFLRMHFVGNENLQSLKDGHVRTHCIRLLV